MVCVLWQAGLNERFAHLPPGAARELCGSFSMHEKIKDLLAKNEAERVKPHTSNGTLPTDSSSWRWQGGMFDGQAVFDEHNIDLSKWDVSRVTDFKHMFQFNNKFNADISGCNAATSASECLKGTYQNQEGQDDCKDCPKGRYNALTARTACVNCGFNKYNDLEGQPAESSCNY